MKFTITAFFIVVIVFYIRWTRCLCKITDILSNHSAIQENFEDSLNKNDEQKNTDEANAKKEYTDEANAKKEYTDEATAKKQEYTDEATAKKEYTDKATDLANKLSGNHKIDISGMFKSSKPSIPDISNLISLGESKDENKSDKINNLTNMIDTNKLTKAQEEAKEEEIKKEQPI